MLTYQNDDGAENQVKAQAERKNDMSVRKLAGNAGWLEPIAPFPAPKGSLRQSIKHYVREFISQDKMQHHIEPSAIAEVDRYRAVKQPVKDPKGWAIK